MKMVLRFEEWLEEREALNVVPVIVGDQDVGFDSAVALPSRPAIVLRVQVIAKRPQAGAAVQNEVRAVLDRKFQAGGVSAVAPRIALERRRRAAHSPKN